MKSSPLYSFPHHRIFHICFENFARVILVLAFHTFHLQAEGLPETTLPVTSIVVSGASIPEPLEHIPSSATVVRGNELAEKQIIHFQELTEQTPGLSSAGGSNRPRFYQIRGIGEFEQYEGAPNPSVGFLIDDIDLSGIGGVGSLFDIEQVEVFRGPQPIRFGANALAGFINLRSKDPTPYWSGSGSVAVANDSYVEVGAAVGGPVLSTSDALLFRASVANLHQDGFKHNEYLNRNTMQRDETTARFKLRALPSNDVTIDFNTLLIDYNNGYDAFTIDNNFSTESDKPGQDDQITIGSSLRTLYQINSDLELQSVTSASRTSVNYSYDGDWGSNEFWGANAPYDYFSSTNRVRRTFSEDLRLASSQTAYKHGESTSWLIGGFAQKLTEDGDIQQYSDGTEYDSLGSRYEATTWALFGEYEHPLANNTAVTVGLRQEFRDAEYEDSRSNDFSPLDEMTGGLLALTHDLSEAHRLYLLASRGFKAGGFNVSTTTPEGRETFDPEYLWNVETGTRSSFFEDKLQLNVSAFSMFRRDQQIKLAIQTDPSDPLTFTYLTDNAARGWNVGTEIETKWQLSPSWQVFLSGTVLDSKLTSVPEEDSYLHNREQSYAPRWQYATGLKVNITENWFARLDLTGRDDYYFDDSHNTKSNPYHLVNASIGFNQGNWSVTGWGKNIFNENYAVRGFFFGNEPPNFENKKYVQLGDRALFGITVAYRF